MITFETLKKDHFKLLLAWLQTEHVSSIYDPEIFWSIDLISKKYSTYCDGYKIVNNHSFLGRGLGSKILEVFLKSYIFPKFKTCVVDPATTNIAAIKCFEKAGFEKAKNRKEDSAARPNLLLFKSRSI